MGEKWEGKACRCCFSSLQLAMHHARNSLFPLFLPSSSASCSSDEAVPRGDGAAGGTEGMADADVLRWRLERSLFLLKIIITELAVLLYSYGPEYMTGHTTVKLRKMGSCEVIAGLFDVLIDSYSFIILYVALRPQGLSFPPSLFARDWDDFTGTGSRSDSAYVFSCMF